MNLLDHIKAGIREAAQAMILVGLVFAALGLVALIVSFFLWLVFSINTVVVVGLALSAMVTGSFAVVCGCILGKC